MDMTTRAPFDPKTESLYHIAGDVPDPTGSGKLGMQASIQLNKSAIGHPLIRWRNRDGDRVIEGDLYEIDGLLLLHIICPKCSTPETPHALWVKQEQKAIEWDPKSGLISVEPFMCTWELPLERRAEFGMGLCKWRVAIDKNIAKEA